MLRVEFFPEGSHQIIDVKFIKLTSNASDFLKKISPTNKVLDLVMFFYSDTAIQIKNSASKNGAKYKPSVSGVSFK